MLGSQDAHNLQGFVPLKKLIVGRNIGTKVIFSVNTKQFTRYHI